MQYRQPQSHIIAETKLIDGGVESMFEALGLKEESDSGYLNYLFSDGAAQELTVVAGKLCYQAYVPEKGNPNVTKVREDTEGYIGNVLKQKHGSVLEHAGVSVVFTHVSRVFTHEIVRHRAGTAFSQESLRYVRLTDLTAYASSAFDGFGQEIVEKTFEELEQVQKDLAAHYEIDSLDMQAKKILTSAFRRLAPIGLQTHILVTANHRAWRHIIEQRCNEHAEEEIRNVIWSLAVKLKKRYPYIYQDMDLDPTDATATFKYGKV